MIKDNNLMEEILAQVGININGSSPWDIKIKDDRTYYQVLQNKSVGLGETYMEGWWECPRIDEFICKILRARLDKKIRGNILLSLHSLQSILCNLQSKIRSCMVVDRHYNLDNELFAAFLDPYINAFEEYGHDESKAFAVAHHAAQRASKKSRQVNG
ncbi:MAG: hypothetical protein ACLQBQ_11015 [Smithella sp.]